MALTVAFATLLISSVPNLAVAQGVIDVEDPEIEQMKKSPEAPTNLDDPILRLNRFSFPKTVLQENSGNQVKNWVVLFCPAWFEPCQHLEPHYRSFGVQWQEKLNGALMSTEVRFAAVDCATEKALCNTQDIGMEYPTILHYRGNAIANKFRGQSLQTDKSRLAQWLDSTLGRKGRDSEQKIDEDKDIEDENMFMERIDLLLLFVAIAGNAWLISRSHTPSRETHMSPTNATPAAPESPPSSMAADNTRETESTARLLPKEWARERRSIDL